MRRLASAGLLAITLGLAAIALAMVVVPAVAGVRAFTVDRNSMQRVIPFGSLEYAAAQTTYAVGDVVVYTHNGNVITHSIIEELLDPATGTPQATWWRTQGSENAAPDDYEVATTSIIGKVVWHAPYLGLATKVLSTLPVRIFLILTAIGLLYASRRPAATAGHREGGGTVLGVEPS